MLTPRQGTHDGLDPLPRRLHAHRACNLRYLRAFFEGNVPFAVHSSKETSRTPCNLRTSHSLHRAIFERAQREMELPGNPQLHSASLSKPTLLAIAPMRGLARLTWSLEKPASVAASSTSAVVSVK